MENNNRKFNAKEMAEDYIKNNHKYGAAATPKIIKLSQNKEFMTEFFDILIKGTENDPRVENMTKEFFKKYDLKF